MEKMKQGLNLEKLIGILFIICFIIIGCTTYKPVGFTGGYSDIPTDSENVAITQFSGNGYTPGSSINSFMLTRLAEITISRGYKYFYLYDSNTNISTSIGSYTTNRTQSSNSNFSGFSNGNYYTGTITTTYNIPSIHYYTINKASSIGIAILTNEKIDELTMKPFYDAQFIYNQGIALSNQYKFWNYTQIGYTFIPDAPLGFQYGILGGWVYGTFNFYTHEPNFKGHYAYEYISPSYSDIFTGKTLIKNIFSFTVGTQIPNANTNNKEYSLCSIGNRWKIRSKVRSI